MSDIPILADLAELRVDGPTIVFLRPRREMSHDEDVSISGNLHVMSMELHRQDFEIQYVLVPHDFDIMAVGEADLSRYGLAKLPEAPAAEAQ